MKDITKILINDFKIEELGMDFMGYSLTKDDLYTYHHLLIPKRHGGPYSYYNGCVLVSNSHNYLHRVEAYDYNRFAYITSEIYDMKVKGELDIANLKNIDELLLEFEDKYEGVYSRTGKPIIKPEYKRRVLRKTNNLYDSV